MWEEFKKFAMRGNVIEIKGKGVTDVGKVEMKMPTD